MGQHIITSFIKYCQLSLNIGNYDLNKEKITIILVRWKPHGFAIFCCCCWCERGSRSSHLSASFTLRMAPLRQMGQDGPRQLPMCAARPCSQSHRRLRCGRRSNGGWSGSQGRARRRRGKGASSESGWLPTISHGESPLLRDRDRSWP